MTKAKTENKKESKEVQFIVGTRGRTFEGAVTKKFPKRVVIELERTIYHQKYERFFKKKTRLHARLPDAINVEVGDYIKIRECRPLSKIIHFIVVEKIRSPQNVEAKK